MTKFPLLIKTSEKVKHPVVPPIMPPAAYESVVGWDRIEEGYKTTLRGHRKYTREAVNYDLLSEVNNVGLWRDLRKIEKNAKATGQGVRSGPVPLSENNRAERARP